MDSSEQKARRRRARHFRVRSRVQGTRERPRLAVYRSLKHIYAQVVDDQPELGSVTLVAVSTRDRAIREQVSYGGNITAAEAVGAAIAERVKALGITAVRFDRGGFRFHGRVRALAEAARKAGLEF
jgi:large subunit ribosomal protein L18